MPEKTVGYKLLIGNAQRVSKLSETISRLAEKLEKQIYDNKADHIVKRQIDEIDKYMSKQFKELYAVKIDYRYRSGYEE